MKCNARGFAAFLTALVWIHKDRWAQLMKVFQSSRRLKSKNSDAGLRTLSSCAFQVILCHHECRISTWICSFRPITEMLQSVQPGTCSCTRLYTEKEKFPDLCHCKCTLLRPPVPHWHGSYPVSSPFLLWPAVPKRKATTVHQIEAKDLVDDFNSTRDVFDDCERQRSERSFLLGLLPNNIKEIL